SFCFFSSRRRHTILSRDWSSDVCSSDLPLGLDQATRVAVAVDVPVGHHSEVLRRLGGPFVRAVRVVRRRDGPCAAVDARATRDAPRPAGRPDARLDEAVVQHDVASDDAVLVPRQGDLVDADALLLAVTAGRVDVVADAVLAEGDVATR